MKDFQYFLLALVQPVVKCALAIEIARRHARQELDGLVDRVDRPDVELARRDRIDHVMTEHKVRDIAARDADALSAGESDEPAGIVETLDLVVDGTDHLNLAVLVHRAGHGDILAQGNVGKGAEQAAQLGHRGTVALDPAVGLLEDQAGRKGERMIAGIALCK